MNTEQRLRNLRDAYHALHDDVLSALRTMVGDPPSLNAVRDRALALASAAEMLFSPPDEYATLQTSITDMVTALDLACHDSMDPPDAAPLTVAHRVPGLVQPGAPVFQSRTNEQGQVEVVHTSTAPPVSVISDADLDQLVASTLEVFPQFGRRMIRGHLKSQGYRIPRDRITASRKKYRVPGPMSLAHLDGQHGKYCCAILIPSTDFNQVLFANKIVIHCIIDGYSRFILGIRVHNNNRGASVLRLLLDVITGVENIEVAVYMEEVKGPGRGSFIWGRSVHNTRIERLWYDVTHGFGKKWKVFFLDLETNHGLNPTRPGHIWLLRHLFLASINRDAQDWAEAWNSHQLTGPRGISSFLAVEEEEEEIEDINEYGIDSEANEEPELIAHLLENNPDE
ncbi:nitrite transporter NirC, partial [Favolaschia claudopus]